MSLKRGCMTEGSNEVFFPPRRSQQVFLKPGLVSTTWTQQDVQRTEHGCRETCQIVQLLSPHCNWDSLTLKSHLGCRDVVVHRRFIINDKQSCSSTVECQQWLLSSTSTPLTLPYHTPPPHTHKHIHPLTH